MKSFAFVAILFAVVGVAESRISIATDASDSFLSFMSEHGKEYSSLSEANYRRLVYLDNVERINKHNANPSHNWKMAMNEFGDLTAEEFKKFYVNGLQGYKTNSAAQVDLSELVTIPDAVDWREKHAVSEVKNQGQCGSCWAFSTTGAVEGATAIKHNTLFSLSEQELVDCSVKDGNHGCSGGLMDFGFTFVRDNKGLCLEKDYAYKAASGTCHDQACSKHGQISKWVDVTKNNQLALKAAVAMQPVSVAIEADSMMFQFYHSGVFDWFWCGTSLDHGVLAVGYGTENGKDYWLVKNSWGSTWGDKGYIKIYRSDNTSDPGKCGIAMQPSYPIAA